MAKFRNVSGNDLFIVALGREVEDDSVFKVPEGDAPGFECQPSNYERLNDEPAAKSKVKE